ncbi:MAG: helix-turn-helix domain-containing protein [Candidatus Woesearchaeota archaeon]
MKKEKDGQTGKALFSNIFGENTPIKIIDFLMMGNNFDFTLSHISNGIGVSRTSVRNSINQLIETGIVEISRVDNKSTYYRIRKEDSKYPLLEDLYNKLQKEVLLAN